MKKRIVTLGVLGALLFLADVLLMACTGSPAPSVPAQLVQAAQAAPANPFYTGDGGKSMSLAVLIPEGRELSEDQAYLPTMVQGVFVADLSKYSAMSVIDRASIENVLKETESGIYNEADFVKLGEINADHVLTGSLTKTSSGFSFQIQITDTKDGEIKASYSGACTIAEFDNYVAIKKASLALLEGMGISLTAQGRAELQQAASQQIIQGQTALAQGITAQRSGTEVTALSYYYQAAVFDPSLLEAANRSSVMTANISSGNIGNDTRNDIQWRKDWLARLTETEQYFDNLFKSSSPPYGLFYLTALERGSVNYTRETTSLSFKTNFHAFSTWFNLVPATVLQAVRDGLDATGRKNDWGLAGWPRQTVSNLNPFQDRRNDFAFIFELVNDKNEVIGRQSLNLRGTWSFSFSTNEVAVNYQENNFQTVTFSAVDANKITDTLTIRVASVNGVDPQTLTRNGSLQITALSAFPPSDFEFSRGVITRYTGSGGNVVIPATIWDDPVKAIGVRAFEEKGITSVTISDSVTTIGELAFYNNRLENVIIPDSVISIGSKAFGYNLVGGFFGTRKQREEMEERHRRNEYYIGEKGQAGGIVFYDKGKVSNGWRYLEAAPSHTEFSFSGGYNSGDLDRGCRNLKLNGYGNWRLPTLNELQSMRNLSGRIGGFSNGWYVYRSFIKEGFLRFSNGATFSEGRIPDFKVRTVRQF